MKENRKTYDRNFKEKAVQLSCERDNISQLAKELGITAPLLYKWRQDYQEFGTEYANKNWRKIKISSFFSYCIVFVCISNFSA